MSHIHQTKKEVLAEIRERLEKNPNIGLYEFVGSIMKSKGIDVDINNLKDIREKAKQLNAKNKKEIAIALSEYKKDYNRAIENFDKSIHKILLSRVIFNNLVFSGNNALKPLAIISFFFPSFKADSNSLLGLSDFITIL